MTFVFAFNPSPLSVAPTNNPSVVFKVSSVAPATKAVSSVRSLDTVLNPSTSVSSASPSPETTASTSNPSTFCKII